VCCCAVRCGAVRCVLTRALLALLLLRPACSDIKVAKPGSDEAYSAVYGTADWVTPLYQVGGWFAGWLAGWLGGWVAGRVAGWQSVQSPSLCQGTRGCDCWLWRLAPTGPVGLANLRWLIVLRACCLLPAALLLIAGDLRPLHSPARR